MSILARFRSVVTRPARFVLVNSVMISTLAVVFAVLSFSGYLAAYRALIPTVQVERDVHFKMRPCGLKDHCQHPVAEVWLAENPGSMVPSLTPGIDYRIELSLELPESETNFDVGMFMASVEMRAFNGQVLKHAQRSGVLVYRSYFLRMLNTAMALPSLILGEGQEKQIVRLPMFDSFIDQPRTGRDFAAAAYIELHSADIQIYSARLRIYADFGGLKYLMYRWPLTSAFVGFLANFIALWVFTALFWIRGRVSQVIRILTGRGRASSTGESKKTDNATTNNNAIDGNQQSSDATQINNQTSTNDTLVAKLASRVPIVSMLQPKVATIVDWALHLSPVSLPGPLANLIRQLVGAQDSEKGKAA